MIELYRKDNKNFDKAGDIVLNCISCTFNANINYNWSLELEHPLDELGIWKEIKEDCIIKFPTPTRKTDLFRIYEINKSEDSIKAYARPLPRDLMKTIITDKNIVDKDGQGSIDRILEDTDFIGHSNIKNVTNIRLVRKNVFNSLFGDEDNTFLSRLGGEIYTNKKDIWINDKIGSDTKNLYVTYGVNLQSMEVVNNFEDVYTRIYPEIYNGHCYDPVDSPLIDKYSQILEGFVKFDDIKLEEDASEEEKSEKQYYTEDQAKAEIKKRINEMYENGLDTPNRTYTIEIANLDNLDLYKDYKFITKIDLGDTITVRDKVLDEDITTRCIEFTWDCINEEYIELKLGTNEENIFNNVSDATEYLKSILTSNKTISGSAIEGIINAVNVQFKAQYNVAERQHVRAMLFEDLDKDSPTYGALCIGTQGLEISNKRNAQDTDWEWGTFITAGIVSADFIRTGLLSNIDGSFQIDLGKKGGAKFYINNNESMEIKQDRITFYDNEGTRIIGGLFSLQRVKDSTQKSMVLGHRDNSFLDIDYFNPEDGNYYPYVQFDKYNQSPDYGYPISFHEDTDFFSNVCHYKPLEMRKPINFSNFTGDTQVGTIFQSTENDLVIGNDTNNSLKLCFKKDDGLYYKAILIHRDDNIIGGCYIDHYGENVFKNSTQTKGTSKYYNGDNETGRVFGSTNGDMIVACNWNNRIKFCYEKDGSYWNAVDIYRNDSANNGCAMEVYADAVFKQNLTVNGTKNRAVKTKNYGTRLLNAVESADAIFTDIGETTIGENGEVRVDIDPIFLETIETKTQKYQVFLTLYGDGKAYVSERNIDHFIIKGTAELDIGFEIKAKQKDYSTTRLEEFKENSSTNIVAVADNKENIIETSKEGELND